MYSFQLQSNFNLTHLPGAQKLTLATFFFHAALSAFYFKIKPCYLREIVYDNS